MTEDRVDCIDQAFIHSLLCEQAPQWSSLPIQRLSSAGTDNAIFRLGADYVLRIPKRPAAAPLLAKELDWLPHLQDLPLRVPMIRFRGHARIGSGCDFAILDWLEGETATLENVVDPQSAAHDLARFLRSLRAKETAGAPASGDLNHRRGVPLAELSEVTLRAIAAVADEVDARRALDLWQRACATGGNRTATWLHGDLKADNLIARGGALCGVIDWGLAAVGDPAADDAAAWSWVHPAARPAFRIALAVDDDEWLRAKGWAVYGAVIALSHYRGGKNEPLCRQSRQTLSRLGLLL